MNEHTNEPLSKLQFDKNRTRVKLCPCGKNNKDAKFAPYVGYENKGYCHSCGETFLPELPNREYRPRYQKSQPIPKPIAYIPSDVLRESLKHYDQNNLITFFTNSFDPDVTEALTERYFIGTSKHYKNATVFPQIDRKGRMRTGKIILYDPITGKRVKGCVNWVHTVTKQPDFNLKQCFFGEHLINDNLETIYAIVESEKTAIIASVYFPRFIWLATCGKDGLTTEKFRVLQGRKVILYPDLSKSDAKVNCFKAWTKKAKELSRIAHVTVSNLLELNASETEKEQGLDIGDFLIKFNHIEFSRPQLKLESFERVKKSIPQPNQRSIVKGVPLLHASDEISLSVIKRDQTFVFLGLQEGPTENWDTEISELTQYFESVTLPTDAMMLNSHSTITDVPKFIESHIAMIKGNNGNRTFLPYLDRLKRLKLIMQRGPEATI